MKKLFSVVVLFIMVAMMCTSCSSKNAGSGQSVPYQSGSVLREQYLYETILTEEYIP